MKGINMIDKYYEMEIIQMKQIGCGAQAHVYLREDGCVVKERQRKSYRHAELDEWLNESRTKAEAKMMERLTKRGMLVPRLRNVRGNCIQMDFVEGVKVKDHLNAQSEGIAQCLRNIGFIIRRLHQIEVIHGDLTTSNMLINQKGIYLIDFGLSYIKNANQDKAVDLYVLERAFKSTHPQIQAMFSFVLEGYGNQAVLKKLETVRMRGRKRIAFG